MESVDLGILLCIRRRQTDAERNPHRARKGKSQGRELTVSELALELVRAELYLRERGRTILLARTLPELAERRANSAGLRRWRDGEAESALVWLCVRGLAECVADEAYAWTRNATTVRLRRLLA